MLGAQWMADRVRLGGPGEDQIQCVGAIKEGFLEEGAWLVPEQEMISPL